MELEEKIKLIKSQNIWWNNKKYSSEKYKRRIFDQIYNDNKNKQVTLITGPRRIGKTVILNQLIEKLLEENISSKNILFINIDDIRLDITNPKDLLEILDYFEKHISKQDSKQKIIILDEIQKLNDWQGILKTYYDSEPNYKFYISGSASNISYMKGSSKLVGRLNKFELLPLSYREFRDYKNYSIKTGPIDLFKISSKELFTKLNINLIDTTEKIFNDYFLNGGYIKLNTIEDYLEKAKEIELLLDLSINKDIYENYKIRNLKKLHDILRLLSRSTISPQSAYNLSKTIKIKPDTISEYLSYLESVYLISNLELYSFSEKGKISSPNKYYFVDLAILNYFNNILDKDFYLLNSYLGQAAENLVFNHLKKYTKDNNLQLGYFQYKDNKEIDFILYTPFKKLPIEVKYQSTISEKELIAINNFINDTDCKYGIIITKNILKYEGKIVYIPLELFLMIF
ncbi:MAG: ATP-binding protein [archaeon]